MASSKNGNTTPDESTIEINHNDGRGWQSVQNDAQSTARQSNFTVEFPNGTNVPPVENLSQSELVSLQMGLQNTTLTDALEDELPRSIYRRLLALKKLEEERELLMNEYKKEVALLDLKYQGLSQPIYGRRADIVSGRIEIESTPEDEAAIDSVTNKTAAQSADEENIKGIPEFWCTAMTNHSLLEQMVTPEDMDALKFLVDIRSHQEPATATTKESLKLVFEFEPNPFFENKILTKVYESAGDGTIERSVGTTIEWKEKRNLCEKVIKKKQRSSSGRTRMVTKVESCPSFFHFFASMDVQSIADETENDEEVELALRQLETDVQLGYMFHEELVPEAVLWFTGEAQDDDEVDGDYVPEEEDDDDDDDESSSGDDTGESEDDIHPAMKPSGDSTENPPECKNQ